MGEPKSKKARMESEGRLEKLFRDHYFIDRTQFIKLFFNLKEQKDKCSFFIRAPYSFGKTTNIRILKCFLEDKDRFLNLGGIYQKKFGRKLEIMEDKHEKFREQHMGQYNVLFFSFHDIKYDSAEAVQRSIIEAVKIAIQQHEKWLQKSEHEDVQRLLKKGKEDCLTICSKIGLLLVHELRKWCSEKKCIVLIDEFDKLAENFLRLNFTNLSDENEIVTAVNSLTSIAHDYNNFITNITDNDQPEDSNMFRCLLLGRTRFGLAASGNCKKLIPINCFESIEIAHSFCLTKEQVEDLLLRRVIVRVCDWLDIEPVLSNLDEFKSLDSIESWKEKIRITHEITATNFEDDFKDRDFLEFFEECLRDKDESFVEEMIEKYNGFIVHDIAKAKGHRKRVFAFSLVNSCFESPDFECSGWQSGTEFKSFSKGLALTDFGVETLRSFYGKEGIKFSYISTVTLSDLLKLKAGLSKGCVSEDEETLNIYKNYLVELGYFTVDRVKKDEFKLHIPNKVIFDSIKSLIELDNYCFCFNSKKVALIQSFEVMVGMEKIDKKTADRFLRALSLSLSPLFHIIKTKLPRIDEANLQWPIKHVLQKCFPNEFKCAEIRIPQHLQQGLVNCNLGTSKCECNRRLDKKIDSAIVIGECCFIIEYKRDNTNAKTALFQIGEKHYYEIKKLPEYSEVKDFIAIGINYENDTDKLHAAFLCNKTNSDDYKLDDIENYECERAVNSLYEEEVEKREKMKMEE